MKNRGRIARKTGFIGAAIGLVLFALVGLLQGSVIGGAVGLGIVNSVLGEPAGPTLLSRVIVAASMLTGVIVAGIMFTTIFSTLGWLSGYVFGWLTEPKAEKAVGERT